MEENTYSSVVQRINQTRQINQVDKYTAFEEKLIQLKPNDWQKFQVQLETYSWPKYIKQKHTNKSSQNE